MHLLTLAQSGKRQASAAGAIAVVIVAIMMVIAGQVVARSLFHSDIAENILGFLPAYFVVWIWLRVWIQRPFWTVGLERDGALGRVLRGAFLGVAMLAVTAGFAMVPGASFTSGSQAWVLAALGLLSYFVQAPAEEVLFRGWLLPAIGARYRPWIGVLVSSVVFSLVHAGSHGITALAFLNLFLFGIFTALYALAEGGIWGVAAWHAMWNWTMGPGLGFGLDGSAHPGLFASIRATGPTAITGGDFGLEGGLACTAVFLTGIVILLNKNAPRPIEGSRGNSEREIRT